MTALTSNAQKSELKAGMIIRCTVEIYASATRTTTKVEELTVTGFRKCPNGLRVRAQDKFGSGRLDLNFECVPKFPTLSVKFEIVE
jgi:hypothetical protein